MSTGYNGTPEGWGNCEEDGACMRCKDSAPYVGPATNMTSAYVVYYKASQLAQLDKSFDLLEQVIAESVLFANKAVFDSA